jgi:hypothetical protein
VPYERLLVNRYKGRKFALLGVNTDSPDRLETAERSKKVTWRSFADGTLPGPIAKQWNVDSVPWMYVIDHKGIIRLKGNLDPEELDAALEPLLLEAEGRLKGSRRSARR